MPEYTFEKRPGALWRSRFDTDQNVIVINKRSPRLRLRCPQQVAQLRYICRLLAKELVIRHFPGYSADELVERMIELLLDTEENLR